MRGGHRMFGWGNLGRDPEVKYTSEGKAVCRFSVAIDEYKGKTEWINVVCFDKTAEACGKYLTKGQPVVFDGRLSTSTWEKDGVKHHKTECVASNVQFLGGPKTEEPL